MREEKDSRVLRKACRAMLEITCQFLWWLRLFRNVVAMVSDCRVRWFETTLFSSQCQSCVMFSLVERHISQLNSVTNCVINIIVNHCYSMCFLLLLLNVTQLSTKEIVLIFYCHCQLYSYTCVNMLSVTAVLMKCSSILAGSNSMMLITPGT